MKKLEKGNAKIENMFVEKQKNGKVQCFKSAAFEKLKTDNH